MTPIALRRPPVETRDPVEEARDRGFIRHDELDRLLDEAGDGRRYDRRARALAVALDDVEIRPSSESARSAHHGTSEFGFLLRGHSYRDPLPTYVRELSRIPRMEREDEIQLAKRLEFVRGRVERVLTDLGVGKRRAMEIMEDSRAHALLDAGWSTPMGASPNVAERRRLRSVLLEYGVVRREFIERNLHLVVAAAAAYRTYDVPVIDLIQEGNAGLIRAVEKFDWRKNVRFRTYATFWIRQAVERAIAHNKGIVRVPNYLQQKMRRLRREGRIPRRNEESSLHEVSKEFDLPPQVVGRLLETERAIRSLDAAVGEDGEERLGSSIAADEAEPMLFSWEVPLLKARMGEALASLSNLERTILEHRFGIGREQPMTLEEVGRVMGLSRERVRQLQVRAIRKLQAPGVLDKLSEFV